VDFELTPEEVKAIRALRRVEKIWPDTLWLFSASGVLHVMRKGEDGEHVHKGEGIDPDYIIDSISILHRVDERVMVAITNRILLSIGATCGIVIAFIEWRVVG